MPIKFNKANIYQKGRKRKNSSERLRGIISLVEALTHDCVPKIEWGFEQAEVVHCVKYISYKVIFLAPGLQFHFEGANSHLLTLWECSISIQTAALAV